MSDLIERLRVNGLIEVAGESGEDRRGPNARLYGIVADRAHVAGIDVRRSAVNVTVADITGRTVSSAVRPLRPGDDLAELIVAAVAEAAGSRSMHAVVLGAPGLVDPAAGDLVADNGVPGWKPNLLQALRHRIGAPVTLENEVNLAAVAEHRAGSARDRDDFVLLWLDDGVGAAVTLGGRLRRGVSGGAGEIGFLRPGGTAICDLVTTEAAHALDPDSLASLIAEIAFTLVAVLDPGLVVLGGDTGHSGGDALAARTGERLTALSPSRSRCGRARWRATRSCAARCSPPCPSRTGTSSAASRGDVRPGGPRILRTESFIRPDPGGTFLNCADVPAERARRGRFVYTPDTGLKSGSRERSLHRSVIRHPKGRSVQCAIGEVSLSPARPR
nr:hypothetical protein GCM10020093_051460 [Planobispora longispora]